MGTVALSVAFLLGACSRKTETNEAWEELELTAGCYRCYGEDFNGYWVPDYSGSTAGNLYIDDGQRISQALETRLYPDGDEIMIEGDGLDGQSCELSEFEPFEFSEPSDGTDFMTPRYEYFQTRDVTYGRARGYWTSYPDQHVSFGEIFLRRALDLTYDERVLQDLDMDIYEPQDDGLDSHPLLVMIHGGAFYNGDKQDEEYRLWCQRFASCGYVAVSVNYRLGFVPYREAVERAAYRALQDVNAAIRYLLSHKEYYEIDPDRIFLAGCSAGAIAALNVAFMSNDQRPASTRSLWIDNLDLGAIDAVEIYGQDDNHPFTVRAIGNMWGAVFDLQLLNNAPTSIISFHSEQDPTVPFGYDRPFGKMLSGLGDLGDLVMPEVYGSGEIDRYCRQIGKRSVLHRFTEPRHTLVRDDDWSINDRHRDFFEHMVAFFHEEMIQHPASLMDSASDEQLYQIDDTDVEECAWSIEGGIITEVVNSCKVRAIFFGDAPRKNIRVRGTYTTGIPFEDELAY